MSLRISVIKIFVILLLLGEASWGAAQTQLPTTGRVLVRASNGGYRPASHVLVLAERLNVCDGNELLMRESSSSGIDASLVRTDTEGVYRIPGKSFDHVCSRILLRATAFLPGYKSNLGGVSLPWGPRSPDGLAGTDAFLTRVDANPKDRAQELLWYFESLGDPKSVTQDMEKRIYREMYPEILKIAEQPQWQEYCWRFGYFAHSVDEEMHKVTCKKYQWPHLGRDADGKRSHKNS